MTSRPGRIATILALGFAPLWGAACTPRRAPATTPVASPAATPDEWSDGFDAGRLDPAKWEPFGFEGDRTPAIEVGNGRLRLRGRMGSRAGVRTRPMFVGDSYVVEATVAKAGSILPDSGAATAGVSPAAPEPEDRAGAERGVSKGAFQEDPNEQPDLPAGNAILTLLFDDTGYNRLEWLLTSEGVFEAWAVLHDHGERLDMGNIGTRVPNPRLAIARRGDAFSFILNDQVAFTRTIRGVPRAFRVFLYGFSSSENVWDAVRVSVAAPK